MKAYIMPDIFPAVLRAEKLDMDLSMQSDIMEKFEIRADETQKERILDRDH